MLLLGVDLADEHGVGGAREPARAEAEVSHVREQQAQRGIERDGEQRGDDHGEVLRVGERLEEPALLRFEREDRQEGDRDHQQREEARAADFLHARR